MRQIVVDTNLCKKDGACVAVCPSGVLTLNEERLPEEVPGVNCILCGHCVAVCDCGALTHGGLPREDFLLASKQLPAPAIIDGFLVSRRSVREFKDRPIARETLQALLDVARRAPTGHNSQKLHWIVVNDAAKVHALSVEAMNWLRTSGLPPIKLEQWAGGYDVVLRGAPTVVLACAPADYPMGKTGLRHCPDLSGISRRGSRSRCLLGRLPDPRIGGSRPAPPGVAVPENYIVNGGLMLGERKYSYRLVPPRKPLSVQWL